MSNEMKSFLDQFIVSYLERDQSEDFSDWLSKRISQELPSLSAEESAKLTEDILAGIARYNQTLAEVNEAVASGQSKEEWLAEKITGSYAELSVDEAGKKLQQIDRAMTSSNAALMGESLAPQEAEETVEWNEYSLKAKARSIAEQAVVTGLAVSAEVVRQNSVGTEEPDCKILQEGKE